MHRWLFIALSLAPQISLAQKAIEAQPGMVITGDREAPLVLYIVPWQEPLPLPPPDVQLRDLPPKVIDDVPSGLEEKVESGRGQLSKPVAQ